MPTVGLMQMIDNCHGSRYEAYLSAEGCRCLLTSTLPCAIRAVDVVETCYAALNAEIAVIVHAEFLCCQLLKAICILRLHQHGMLAGWSTNLENTTETEKNGYLKANLESNVHRTTDLLLQFLYASQQHYWTTRTHLCGPRISLLETSTLDFSVELSVFGIDAGTGGVEESAEEKTGVNRWRERAGATIADTGSDQSLTKAPHGQRKAYLSTPSMRDTSIMLKLIIVLLYMMTE
jgi:hypothetical protein